VRGVSKERDSWCGACERIVFCVTRDACMHARQVDYFKRITLRDEIFRPMQVCACSRVRLRLLMRVCVCQRGLAYESVVAGRKRLKQARMLQVVGGPLAYDVWATVQGGGLSAQAGAIRLGVSRALQAFDPQHRDVLKQHRLLTQDDRQVFSLLQPVCVCVCVCCASVGLAGTRTCIVKSHELLCVSRWHNPQRSPKEEVARGGGGGGGGFPAHTLSSITVWSRAPRGFESSVVQPDTGQM